MPDPRALACLALLAAGTAASTEAPAPERQSALERLLYQDCGSCHGMTLRGGLGSDLTAEALAGRDPGQLARIVLDGVPGTAMPPWRPLLSEAEAAWIADYLIRGGSP